MRVCAVGLRGLPGVMGGIEAHCQALYPSMVAHDPSIEVVVLGRKPYLPKGSRSYQGVKVIPLPAWRQKYVETLFHTLVAVLHARFAIRPDVLHLHAIGPALFCPLARLLGMPVVVTHHGADYDRSKWRAPAKALLRLGEFMALRFANRIIVVGRSLAQRLQEDTPAAAERIEFLPNGVPQSAMNARTAVAGAAAEDGGILHRYGLKSGGYILAVGRLVPEKGFHDLIEAFGSLGPGCRKLVIVGRADHGDKFSKTLRSRASESLVFTGFQSGAALETLRRNAALFVLPSHHEGMPITALEALGAGLPTLLSDIEPNLDLGLPEHCYFPAGDVSALAAKIGLADYSRYRCASDLPLGQLDWRKIAIRTAEILRQAADREVIEAPLQSGSHEP